MVNHANFNTLNSPGINVMKVKLTLILYSFKFGYTNH